MNLIAENWKSPVAVLIAVLALYFASLRVDARRHETPAAKPAAPAQQLPLPQEERPTSNEIPQFQQLG